MAIGDHVRRLVSEGDSSPQRSADAGHTAMLCDAGGWVGARRRASSAPVVRPANIHVPPARGVETVVHSRLYRSSHR